MWVAFAFVKATHMFQQKYLCVWIRYCTYLVNILTTNEFVKKLTMLWTIGPRWIIPLIHLILKVFSRYVRGKQY